MAKMRLGLLALLASNIGLFAAIPSYAQGLNFGNWSLHTSPPEGGKGCYFGSQLSNSTTNIEIRFTATADYKLHVTLLESDWAALPDSISPVVTMKFYNEEFVNALESYTRPAVKSGKAITYDFGTNKGFSDSVLYAAQRFTIDLAIKADGSSAAPSGPMPSEINLPWVSRTPATENMTAKLVKCDQDNTPEAEKPSLLSSMSGENQKSTLLVLYVDYAIADRCAAADASFNKSQVAAMQTFIKSEIGKAAISRKDNDDVWNAVQSQLTSKNLTEKDCEDTRKQAAYLFPPATFMSGGKQNPF